MCHAVRWNESCWGSAVQGRVTLPGFKCIVKRVGQLTF